MALLFLKRTLRQAAFLACHAGLRTLGREPAATVFILGHMRSGSTLLLHILLSHPDIAGRGEQNTPYRTVRDLHRLAMTARFAQGPLLRRFRYVVDQINHDRFTPNEALLQDSRVRLLFLIREPPASLSSIVHLTRTFYAEWPMQRVADYYVQRLNTLARYAELSAHDGRALPLSYQALVADTSSTLGRLRAFLDLETGLSERYDMQPFTGCRGDPSDTIRAGRIVRDREPPRVEIPADVLDRAWQAYDACRRVLEGLD
ncbi:MAG: sulfotransferase [Planctomycetota bacterium]|nr:sulfotransferase [Planctomycetota bacterium]